MEVVFIHEGTHWWQQKMDGFETFYGKTSRNYISQPIYEQQINYIHINPVRSSIVEKERIIFIQEQGVMPVWIVCLILFLFHSLLSE